MADAELAGLQRAAFATVLYAGSPLPPMPSEVEIAEARTAILAGAPWERSLLDALYPDDLPLQAMALRDTDADGIPDFRVSDYYGRFLEGDTDADGDGIDNLLDPAPFDFAGPGADGSGLPPALDWARAARPPAMVAVQQALYEDHGIVLAERTARFTPGLAAVVGDAVTRVFSSVFATSSRLPTLRLIATAESPLLVADTEDAEDFAQVFPATGTMEIYRPGIDAPAIVQLGFVVHEIGHSLQYALDFSAAEQQELVRRNTAPARHFHALVAAHGWSRRAIDPDPAAEYTLFRPQYIASEPYEYLYLGRAPDEWIDWLDDIRAESGEGYLSDGRIVQNRVLGEYSLSSPWEWHSDELIAYVYLEMLDSLGAICPAAELERIARSLQDDVSTAWPDFRFENARGDPFQDYLRETYPIDARDARYLAVTYLPADACGR